MSSPTNIKKNTLQTLRGTRRDMSRAKFLLAMKRQPKNIRRKAALARMDVEQAILAMGNAKIANIGAKLQANEAALKNGTAELKKARRKLNRVNDVLGKVGALLKTIAKVVKFTTVG